ncbi:hypothetical protein EAE96_009076 [Botrytis aclada]|nr:hypothetical protein EAE96_009076 [Botrytis aclada]
MPCHWHPPGKKRCKGAKEPGTIFCIKHICRNEKCPEQMLNHETWWCEKHSPCTLQPCALPRHHSTLTCTPHKCHTAQCPSPQFLPSNHCSGHKCHIDNCLRARALTNRFCDLHECAKGECMNLKDLGEGRVLCAGHSCAVVGCLEGRGEGVVFCEGHGRGGGGEKRM